MNASFTRTLAAGVLWLAALSAPSLAQGERPHGPFHANWEMIVPNRAFEIAVNFDHYPSLEAGHGILSISTLADSGGAGFHCPREESGFGGFTSGAFCGELFEGATRDNNKAEILGVRYAEEQAIAAWSFANEETVRLLVVDRGGKEPRMSILHPKRGVDASYPVVRRPHDCNFMMCQYGGDFVFDEISADPRAAMGSTADLAFLRQFRDMVELRVPGAESPGDEDVRQEDYDDVQPVQYESDVSSIQNEWTVYDIATGETLLYLDLFNSPGNPAVNGSGRVVGGPLAMQGTPVFAEGEVGPNSTRLDLEIGDGTSRLEIDGGNGPILTGSLQMPDGRMASVELRSAGMPAPDPAQNAQPENSAGWAPRHGGSKMSYWNHNGSGMAWEVDGDRRTVWYFDPREGLSGSGVRRGTILFEGRRDGRRIVGTAYTFSGPCGPAGFPVSGPIGARDESVTLEGTAPRRDELCNIHSQVTERLNFNFVAMQPDGGGTQTIDEMDAPGVGVSGDRYVVRDLPKDDILNMRAGPSTKEEVVGFLDERITFSLIRCEPRIDAARWERANRSARRSMLRRAWCLAAWDDMQGWVYGRYVDPVE